MMDPRVLEEARSLDLSTVEGRFRFGDLAEMTRRFPPERLRDGWNTLPGGEEIYYISNPGLGLWGTPERFGDA